MQIGKWEENLRFLSEFFFFFFFSRTNADLGIFLYNFKLCSKTKQKSHTSSLYLGSKVANIKELENARSYSFYFIVLCSILSLLRNDSLAIVQILQCVSSCRSKNQCLTKAK